MKTLPILSRRKPPSSNYTVLNLRPSSSYPRDRKLHNALHRHHSTQQRNQIAKKTTQSPPPYHHSKLTRFRSSRSLLPTTPFVNCHDTIYYSSISFGTPSRQYQVILDTGSSDLWLFSTDCEAADCPLDADVDRYDQHNSSSYTSANFSFDITYMDGDGVAGVQGVDVLVFAGLTIERQGFAKIEESKGFRVNCVEDGVLGMAFDQISINRTPTPLTNIFHLYHELVNDEVFGFYLTGTLNNDEEEGQVGELTIGWLNSGHYIGELTWIDLSQRTLQEMYPNELPETWDDYTQTQLQKKHDSGYWDFDITRTRLGIRILTSSSNNSNNNNLQGAVVDTGTTMIFGPPNIVYEMYSMLKASCLFLDSEDEDDLFHILPCIVPSNVTRFEYQHAVVDCLDHDGEEFNLSFDIGGKWFNITKEEYLINLPLGNDGEGHCPSGYVLDCLGQCINEPSWLGDGNCDSGAYGVFFNCPRLNCDNGDCPSSSCSKGEQCLMAVYPNNFGVDSWLLGDVFLRSVYTGHDVGRKRVGFAQSRSLSPTNLPSVSPSPSPTSLPSAIPSSSISSSPSFTPLKIITTANKFTLSHPFENAKLRNGGFLFVVIVVIVVIVTTIGCVIWRKFGGKMCGDERRQQKFEKLGEEGEGIEFEVDIDIDVGFEGEDFEMVSTRRDLSEAELAVI